MKITSVKVTSKGTHVSWLHQNAEDDETVVLSIDSSNTSPTDLLKALNDLDNDAKKIAGLSKDAIIDIKGISIKHKENQTGLSVSFYHHINDGSGLGFAFATPFKYDIHENEEFKLPENIMERVTVIRDEATKFVKRYFDQMDLF